MSNITVTNYFTAYQLFIKIFVKKFVFLPLFLNYYKHLKIENIKENNPYFRAKKKETQLFPKISLGAPHNSQFHIHIIKKKNW